MFFYIKRISFKDIVHGTIMMLQSTKGRKNIKMGYTLLRFSSIPNNWISPSKV